MNFEKLFMTQQALDEKIYEKHPELKGQDNLDWKVLALQVELGECANEWRGFKKWSNDQEQRKLLSSCKNSEAEVFYCGTCHEKYKDPEQLETDTDGFKLCPATECDYNLLMPMKETYPLLEEYVDCLHFALSIGLELGCQIDFEVVPEQNQPVDDAFMEVMAFTTELYWLHRNGAYDEEKEKAYETVVYHLIALSHALGFTWEQIEEAYFEKNKVNHERQASGY